MHNHSNCGVLIVKQYCAEMDVQLPLMSLIMACLRRIFDSWSLFSVTDKCQEAKFAIILKGHFSQTFK